MNVKRITSEHDLHTAFEIRKTVFVEEQGCPVSDEFDEFDTLREDCRPVSVSLNTWGNWKESAF